MRLRRPTSAGRRAFLILAVACVGSTFLWRRLLRTAPGIRRFPRMDIPKPTAQQLAWQDLELGMFIHLGMATFTGRENEVAPPDRFKPKQLDTDQWLAAAVAMGARYAVLVAKHSDGFLMWQSEAYPYGLKQSAWREGKGDLVSDFIESCRKCGVKPGLYASTCANAYWGASYPGYVRDREADGQRAYNAATESMLAELWSRYGALAEIWFDSGVLPVEQGGPDIMPLLEKYQPGAMVMQSEAATIRLSGGETGMVGYPCWATARRRQAIGRGHPDGEFWLPVECDTPIRHHAWFWQPDTEHKLFEVSDLVKMYYGSIGRNGNLLVNAAPNRAGLIPEADLALYAAFGKEIHRRFGATVAETSGTGRTVDLLLKEPNCVDHMIIQEDVTQGERVRRYEVSGLVGSNQWRRLCAGTSIGHKRIHRFERVEVAKVRLECTQAIRTPKIRRMALYVTS